MSAKDILEDQIIHVKRGRLNGLGFEPAFNSYFDFYLSAKYFGEPLLELEDLGLHLYLRKNLNDTNKNWKMPTIRQMMAKFGISQKKLTTIMGRLEKAHLLYKESGVKGGMNVRNDYILSDPISTLAEFLEVAAAGLFRLTLLPAYIPPCITEQYTDVLLSDAPRVLPSDTDQQTLKTKQTADTVEKKLWNNVLKQLQLPADTFNTFLSDTSFKGVEDGVAVITTSRSYAKDWLENRMCNQIRKVLAVELRMNGGQKIESVRCEITQPRG